MVPILVVVCGGLRLPSVFKKNTGMSKEGRIRERQKEREFLYNKF